MSESRMDLRPTLRGGVIGLGLGQYRFVGSGVGLFAAACLASAVFAGPEGANVVSGNASIRQNGNNTVIRASNGAIIDYTRFDVGAGERVRFVQPSRDSRVLNRINSDAPTRIDGTIRSNGIVYFANRAGVIFGPTSVINTGGIFAAAGSISNDDFKAGLNRFTDVRGEVINHGLIETRFAGLVGERIQNTGTITADGGIIAMVAGNEVVLSERGGNISVKVDPTLANQGRGGSGTPTAAIENTGTIRADRGRAMMVAGDMYSLAVRNTGTVKARDIRLEGKGNAGVQVSGTLDASNQRGLLGGKGGNITVTGEFVQVTGATIDATGTRGGGDIRLGGDYLGNGTLRNATNTSIDANSTIDASATRRGDGGRIIVWSDNTTGFYGQAKADGGSRGGDGGFIETSGKINLDVRAANVSARNIGAGRAGTWLMDPVNVRIDAVASSGGAFDAGNPDTFTPDNTGSPAIVDVATVNATLSGGTSVTILTGTVGTDAGNIEVAAPILKSGGGAATLTLRAANDVLVNSTITSTSGVLNVNLQANSSGSGNNDLNAAAGNVVVNADITTNGGTFSSSGVDFDNLGGPIATGTGSVTLNHTGAVSVRGAVTAGGFSVTNSASFLNDLGGTIAVSGGGNVSVTSSGATSFFRQVDTNGGTFTTSGTDFGTSSSGQVNTSNGNVNINNTGNITLLQAINLGSGSYSSSGVFFSSGTSGSITSLGGNVSITPSGNVDLGGAISTGGGAFLSSGLNFGNVGTATIGTANGNVTINNTGSVVIGRAVTTGTGNFLANSGSSFLTSGTGTITTTGAGTVTIGATGGVTLATAVNTGGGAFVSTGLAFNSTGGSISTANGNVTISNTGAVTIGGAVNAGTGNFLANSGSSFLTSGTGTITTTGAGTVTIGATGGVTLATAVNTGGGAFVSTGLAFNSTGGSISTANGNVTISNTGAVTIGGAVNTGTGNFLANSGSSFDTSGTGTITTTGAGTVTIGATGAVTIATAVNTGGGAFTSTGGAFSNVGGSIATAGGNVNIDHTGVITIGGATNADVSSVSSVTLKGSGLTFTGPGSVAAGSGGLFLISTGSPINVFNGSSGFVINSSVASALTLSSASNAVGLIIGDGSTAINVGSSGPANFASLNSNVVLNGTTLTFNGQLSASSSRFVRLSATGNVVDANSGVDVAAGELRLAVSGTAALDASVDRLGSTNVVGALTFTNDKSLIIGESSVTVQLQSGGSIRADGNISVGGALSIGSAMSFITRSNAGGSINLVSPDALTYNGPLTLRSLNAGGGATSSGDISINYSSGLTFAQVDTTGTFSITTTGAGDITATGPISTGGLALNISNGSVTFNDLRASGVVSGSVTGATADLTLINNQLLRTGILTVTRDISLTSTDLDIQGNLSAGRNVTLQPVADASTVGLNSSGFDYVLSALEFGRISGTFVTIGRASGTGAMSIGSNGALDLSGRNFDLRLRGGATTFANTLTLADNKTLTLALAGATQSGAGSAITIGADGGLQLLNAGTTNLNTSVARVAGVVNGATTIVNAGTLSVGQVGTSTGFTGTAPSLAITASTGDLNLNEAINTAGNTAVQLTSSAGSVNFATGAAVTSGGTGTIAVDANGSIGGPGDASAVLTASTVSLTATTGSIGSFAQPIRTATSTLNATAGNGLTINNSGNVAATLNSGTGTGRLSNTGTLSTGASNWSGDTFVLSSTGNMTFGRSVTATTQIILNPDALLTVSSGGSLNAPAIVITAPDVDIAGAINAGSMGAVSINRPTGGSIGLGTATGDMVISNSELSQVTAGNLTIGDSNTTLITVTSVAGASVANIGRLTLDSGASGGNLSFTGGASTFRALTASAADSITINSNISATNGTLVLISDSNAGADAGGDRINVASGVTIATTSPSGGDITISGSGGIVGAGSLTIDSNAGLAINNGISAANLLRLAAKGGISIASTAAGQQVNITADNGVTISDNLTSSGGTLIINADANGDGTGLFSLAAGKSITTGNSDINVTAADVDLLGTIVAGTGRAAFSRANAGSIGLGVAAGDLQLSSAELARITAGGLGIGNSLTSIINIDTVGSADVGNINGSIELLSNDINIAGAFNSGSSVIRLARATDGNIFVGTSSGGYDLSGAELQRITAPTLEIGGALTNAVIVGGVTGAQSGNISGVIRLIANNNVTFANPASTFRTLDVQARNGVVVNSNLTTTVGDLTLDADSNNASNGNDRISFAPGRTVTSAGKLVLKAATGVNGGISAAGDVALNAAGDIDIRNDFTSAGQTDINADSDASGAGNFILASGRTLTTGGNLLNITAADYIQDGTINAGAGGMVINRSTNGTLGLGTATGSMSISGAELGRIVASGLTIGSTNTITDATVAGVTAGNSNAITGITQLNAGTITFNGDASVFNSLDARARSGMTISSNVASDTGALRLDANSDGIGNEFISLGANLSANIVPATGANPTTGFAVDVLSPVRMTANSTVTGRNITFSKAIDSATTTARSLTLNSLNSGVTKLQGDIGLVNRLQTLTTNADGKLRLGGTSPTTLRTIGTVRLDDGVRLVSNYTIDTSGGAGVIFNNTVDTAGGVANRNLTVLVGRATAEGASTLPLISFARNVGSSRALGNLFLNYTPSADGRAAVPGIATIIARPRDNNGAVIPNPTAPFSMSFTTTGAFRMGRNEKLTSGGALTINAPGGAFLGDLTALGNLRVNSPNIRLIRRDAGRILGDQGALGRDNGLDFVARGQMDFTSIPTVIGTGPAPRFGTPDGLGDRNSTLSGFVFQRFGDITNVAINSSGTLRTLDLQSSGPTNTNIADTIAGAIPRESRAADVGQSPTISEAQKEQIQQLGIVPRSASSSELMELLTGSATFDDFPRRNPPTAQDYTTVVNRLPADKIERLLTSYNETFNKPKMENGEPVIVDGKPQFVSRTDEIREALLASVRRFREASGAKTADVDPSAFRAFLEQNASEATSLTIIRQLNAFLDNLDRIGLTAREQTTSKNLILGSVRPRGIRAAQFESIIRAEGSRASR